MKLFPSPVTFPLACLIAVCITSHGTAQSEGLLLPYKIPAMALKDAKPLPKDCMSGLPDPVVALKLESIYDQSDKYHAKIDAEAKKVYDGKLKPVRDFTLEVTDMANKYVASGGKDVGQALCAMHWISAWAHEDALAQLESRQSNLSVTRIVAGLALAYTQLPRQMADFPQSQRDEIDAWLQRRAEAAMATYGDGSKRKSDLQNHRYWGGLAVAAVGVATGRKDMLQWGVESYRIGVCQIDSKGALPLELARGSRARDYHLHAITPLIMIAELAQANGINAYDMCDGAIHRLVGFVIEAVVDAHAIDGMAGKQQLPLSRNSDGTIRGDRLAWIEPYLKRFPSQDWVSKLNFRRPLKSSKIGGNLTLLYGA
jgi:poly(beta-D-mannuronate) lyase